ncbi:MAG TPA: site-specific integrase [Candidatus Obscuribacterales bacterium]
MPTIKNGLYRRGNSWYICVKANGKQIRKSFGSDKRAAELALLEIRKQRVVARAQGDWSGLEKLTEPKKRKTFEEAAADYLTERAHGKQSTLRTYGEHLKNYLLPEFGKLQVSDITEEHIARFQSDLLSRRQLSERRTNSTINLLSSILKVCVRRKFIEDNPAKGIRRLREPKASIDPLSREELDLALSCLSNHFRPLFTCLAWTGARPGELIALRWNDVSFERNEIHINKARVKGVEDLPKTGSSERFIPMLPPVRDALLKLKADRKVASIDGTSYVFVGKAGQPINRHLDATWAAALKKAGLRHRPSYQLRHTFASLCLQAGAEPGWISKTMGHSNLQTFFQHYARYIPSASKQNEQIVARFAAASPDKPDGAQKGAQTT